MRPIVIISFLIPTIAYAQQPAQPPAAQSPAASPPPKTQIEQFEARTGSVIIKGFSDMGTLAGKYGSSVSVSSMEFTDASNGTKQFGVTIDIKGSGDYPHKNRSYIDLDEVDSLLNGIDYIGRADKSITKLANFEATYRTKGDFSITVFSSPRSGNMVSVDSGRFGAATAFLDIADLSKLRQLIQKAQATLQSFK